MHRPDDRLGERSGLPGCADQDGRPVVLHDFCERDGPSPPKSPIAQYRGISGDRGLFPLEVRPISEDQPSRVDAEHPLRDHSLRDARGPQGRAHGQLAAGARGASAEEHDPLIPERAFHQFQSAPNAGNHDGTGPLDIVIEGKDALA